jgi:hypothetical protein
MEFERRMREEYEVDPGELVVESIDEKFVHVGLIISRPPIFMTMEKEDRDFMKWRHDFMQEYYMDQSVWNKTMKELASSGESVLRDSHFLSN